MDTERKGEHYPLRPIWPFLIGPILLALGLVYCAITRADDGVKLFSEVGASYATKPPCKLWHQACGGHETDFHMTDFAFRLGVEKKYENIGIRLSYADLGGYEITGWASRDEDTMVASRGMDYYITRGSFRAFVLSGTYTVPSNTFFEIGVHRHRQSFHMESIKCDGYTESWDEALYGWGSMFGIGQDFKTAYVALTAYKSKVASKFNQGGYPSGVDTFYVASVGKHF